MQELKVAIESGKSDKKERNPQRQRQRSPGGTPLQRQKRPNLQPTPDSGAFHVSNESKTPPRPIRSRQEGFLAVASPTLQTPARQTPRLERIVEEKNFMSPTAASMQRMVSRKGNTSRSEFDIFRQQMNSSSQGGEPRRQHKRLSESPASTATTISQMTESTFHDEMSQESSPQWMRPFASSSTASQEEVIAFPQHEQGGSTFEPALFPSQGSACIAPIPGLSTESADNVVQVAVIPKAVQPLPCGTQVSQIEIGGVVHEVTTRKGSKAVFHHQRGTKTIPETRAVLTIPSRKELVDSTQAAIHLKSHERLERFRTVRQLKEFSLDPNSHDPYGYSRRMLGGLIACTPKVSSLAYEQIFPFILSAYLPHFGLDLTTAEAIDQSPSRETVENIVKDFALDSLVIITDIINEVGVMSLSFDKADLEKKGTFGGCSKLGAVFDVSQTSDEYPDGKIIVFPIDADKTGGTSKDVADGVGYSVNKLALAPHVTVGSITVDSGGGGTGRSVETPKTKKSLTSTHCEETVQSIISSWR